MFHLAHFFLTPAPNMHRIYIREFDKSGMLGFATAIYAESALKSGILVRIIRFFSVYLPLNPTYRFIFKFTLYIKDQYRIFNLEGHY